MKVLLDTNVLLRLAVVSHPTHTDAVSAVHKIRHRGDDPVIVPQVLYEYWVVATKPTAQNGLGLGPVTMQLLGTNWLLGALIGVTDIQAQLGQEASSSERVGHRSDRIEPSANKRRPKVLALMTKPRRDYHAELGVAV